MRTIQKPLDTEYAPFYKTYIDKIESTAVLDFLADQMKRFNEICTGIPETKTLYKYEEGKWTIKELVGHCIDTERVMSYRLLRISRGDETSLAGFDENEYVRNSNFNTRDWATLLMEFHYVRASNLILINSLSDEQLLKMGKANELTISARAIVYIIAGHLEHHLDILIRRYLK
jgi:hypothetical protein